MAKNIVLQERDLFKLVQQANHPEIQTLENLMAKFFGKKRVAIAMFRRILYWLPYSKRDDGAIYKKADDLADETSSNPRSIQRYNKYMREVGFHTFVKKVHGTPTTHYRLEMHRFVPLLADIFDTTPEQIYAWLPEKLRPAPQKQYSADIVNPGDTGLLSMTETVTHAKKTVSSDKMSFSTPTGWRNELQQDGGIKPPQNVVVDSDILAESLTTRTDSTLTDNTIDNQKDNNIKQQEKAVVVDLSTPPIRKNMTIEKSLPQLSHIFSDRVRPVSESNQPAIVPSDNSDFVAGLTPNKFRDFADYYKNNYKDLSPYDLLPDKCDFENLHKRLRCPAEKMMEQIMRHGFNRVQYVVERAEQEYAQGRVRNITGFVIAALRDNYKWDDHTAPYQENMDYSGGRYADIIES